MRARTLFLPTLIGCITTFAFLTVNSHALRGNSERGGIGPDVVAWAIGGQNGEDIDYAGSSAGMGGYSMATVSCNWGDETLNWYGGTNNSPIIMQNMFRLKDGKFEQIGIQSFMKHSFCALSEPGCGSCQSTNCDTLGIGCADTYWAGLNLNGDAPRSDVNAFTGVYPYPFTHSPSGPSATRGNLVVANVDVDPALNSGARYFMEAMYIAADDHAAGNGDNNASWREIGFNSISDPYILANGPEDTHAGDPAIRAWAEIDHSVVLTEAHAPEDGLILLAVKVVDNGDGSWDYDYAMHNLNCDRSIGVVEIPTASAIITNIGFKDIDHNSGEIYDGTDWIGSADAGQVSWSGQTYEENQNANALRWGTMWNFSFTASAGPKSGMIDLGLFKPGGASSFAMNTLIPGGAPIDPCDLPLGTCPEDIDDSGTVGVGDILAIIDGFGETGDGTYRPTGDVNGDCTVNVEDLLQVVAVWGQDCTPEGACCLGDGSCSEGSEATCLEMGGDWQGVDSLCASSSCPAPGACCFSDGACAEVMYAACVELTGNFQGDGSTCAATDCPIAGAGDECASAMIASVGANPFETNTATPSPDEPDSSQCSGTYLDWQNSPDIWFLFVPSASGSMHFTTCDSDSFDTSMALYQGACDNQVACNGDSEDGSGCQQYHSAIDYNVDAGQAYYIRIGGWKGGTGEGTLTIE